MVKSPKSPRTSPRNSPRMKAASEKASMMAGMLSLQSSDPKRLLQLLLGALAVLAIVFVVLHREERVNSASKDRQFNWAVYTLINVVFVGIAQMIITKTISDEEKKTLTITLGYLLPSFVSYMVAWAYRETSPAASKPTMSIREVYRFLTVTIFDFLISLMISKTLTSTLLTSAKRADSVHLPLLTWAVINIFTFAMYQMKLREKVVYSTEGDDSDVAMRAMIMTVTIAISLFVSNATTLKSDWDDRRLLTMVAMLGALMMGLDSVFEISKEDGEADDGAKNAGVSVVSVLVGIFGIGALYSWAKAGRARGKYNKVAPA